MLAVLQACLSFPIGQIIYPGRVMEDAIAGWFHMSHTERFGTAPDRFRTRVMHATAVALFILVSILAVHVAAHMTGTGSGSPFDTHVLWPYHAGLMTVGFSSLVAAGLLMHYKKTYRFHRNLATFGIGATMSALAVAVVMVTAAGTPHLQYSHAWLGITGLVIMVAAPVLIFASRGGGSKPRPGLRVVHRWSGRTVFAFMALAVISGLSMYFASMRGG